MKDWYEQAEIWSFYSNSKTREDYVKNWVIEGHFHDEVPKDIIDAYETAAYLMAHAWYHWPMFDEALRKLMGIFEMAIRKRSEALGIATTYLDRAEREKNKNLNTLIDQVASREADKDLKDWMHNVREIRNMLMHPKQNSFAGGMVSPRIKGTVNLINLLFLDNEVVKAAKEKTESMQAAYAAFKEGLFILEYNDERMLLVEAEPIEAFKIEEDWVSLWLFRPVLTDTYETLSNHRYSVPPFLTLKAIELVNGHLEARSFVDSKSLKLIPTNNPQNQRQLEAHLEEWKELKKEDQFLYNNFIQRKKTKAIHDFMYRRCWK